MVNGPSANDWPSIAGLLADHPEAAVALLGAGLAEGCVTPGRCDLAPPVFRQALRRISTYDLEAGLDLSGLAVHDAGDLALAGLSPAACFEPVSGAVQNLGAKHALVCLIGGNNAVTRPGVHGIDAGLKKVGLLTLDAHFDLRPTDGGLINGNPVSALLEDGLPGQHIVQIGLAPFANTKAMHDRALDAGITVRTLADCRQQGVVELVSEGLKQLSQRCDAIYVDFDIDVIERSQLPGAPGGRPGGLSVCDFLAAARVVGQHEKVRAVDLTEFDPSLDVSDISALVAGRWFAEILAGFAMRHKG
ncbi:arginase family protein [Parvularcula sp. IMCC14364]|uniref:arginase family protein n=1 Tax=Parvularcula sp. IMCC14364 TaxID=3067902 RepID=UPI002741F8DE|nr:arginase family protein [Parvularcula sp. IMCC14364]